MPRRTDGGPRPESEAPVAWEPGRRQVLAGFGAVALGGIGVLGWIASVPSTGVGGPADPTASFAYEYDGTRNRVEIRMTAGPDFEEDDTHVLAYGTRNGSLSKWELPASAGDLVTVEGVEPGDVLVVRWFGVDRERRDVLWQERIETDRESGEPGSRIGYRRDRTGNST